MKILYGLSGEGFGHSSRAKTIVPYLLKKGHEVKVITYGQSVPVLRQDGFDVFEIKGVHLHFKEGKLKKRLTLKKGLANLFSNIKKSKHIHQLMKEGFDLCISDFEPIVPVLRYWYNLPLLCFDNQHRLTNMEIIIPKEHKIDAALAYFATKTIVSKADWYIITAFGNIKAKDKYKKNTYLVPPVIRGEIIKLNAKKKKYILVYLTKKDRRLIKILKEIKENFVVYGFEKEKKDKNLVFHKSGKYFANDLADCKAIIASAGFTLISEALYFKKPYFALPLQGQFEQVLNALFLKESGFGDYSEKPDKAKMQDFLINLKSYEKRLEGYNPDYSKLFKSFDAVLKKAENQKCF